MPTTTMCIPTHTEEKIREYLDLWDAMETRELTPEEKIEGIHAMEKAKSELFVQALFTVRHRQLTHAG